MGKAVAVKKEFGHIKTSLSDKMFTMITTIIVSFVALVCVIPFVMIISGSFSEQSRIVIEGYALFPKGFTLDAYTTILSMNTIPRGYMVTIFITLVGTSLGLVTTSISGFVLSRNDFKNRNIFAFFIYFTTLFNAGMIPSYLVNVNVLHLNNNIWVLILPAVMSPFNIFLYRNFVKGIPNEFVESARIDGAGDFTIYYKIILPLTKPAAATIGLFMALGYWNEWFNCNLYIKDANLRTLQYLLYSMLVNMQAMLSEKGLVGQDTVLPSETMKLATAVLATGPVLLFYPFVQKYFVGGLVIGGVKG